MYRRNPVSFKRIMKMYEPLIEMRGGGSYEETYQLRVKDFIDTFEREDRVIYIVQLHRLREALNILAKIALSPREQRKLNQLINKIRFAFGVDPSSFNDVYPMYMDSLKHFIVTAKQNDYYDVLDYTWHPKNPGELIEQLELLEKTAIEKSMGKILPLREGRILINFSDGYYWTMLPTGQCELEGQAMAHCGNVGNKFERILSLRNIDADGNPKAHLTFIWHQIRYPGEMSVPWPAAPNATRGYLGEMKGYANTKPAKKYHKHIIELLKLPMIQLVVGGGYASQSNFSLEDLTHRQQKELYQEKPELFGIKEFYSVYGLENTSILAATLTGIDGSPPGSPTPTLPIIEFPQGLMVEILQTKPFTDNRGQVDWYRLEMIDEPRLREYIRGLITVAEWEDKKPRCRRISDEYVGRSESHFNRTLRSSDEIDDENELEYVPKWEDINFERYLTFLYQERPDLYQYFIEDFEDEPSTEELSEYIRRHPSYSLGDEYYHYWKIFYPLEDMNIRHAVLQRYLSVSSETGLYLEIAPISGVRACVSLEKFLGDLDENLSGLSISHFFIGLEENIGIPSIPTEPVSIPPSRETLDCLTWIIEAIRADTSTKDLDDILEENEDLREWLRQDDEEIDEYDRQRGFGDYDDMEDADDDDWFYGN